jgi:uncharacterized protein (DUF2249 family)
MPAALAALPDGHRVRVDVREEIARGGEPFARIMAAVAALGPRDALLLRAPFEPQPLYRVLATRGFQHWTERHADDDWTVWFWRDAPAAPGPAPAPTAPAPVATLDVRRLEPPLPMVQVLERIQTLGAGEVLDVLLERRPIFLYPQLEARGFAHQTDEPAPGVVRVRIQRGGPAS